MPNDKPKNPLLELPRPPKMDITKGTLQRVAALQKRNDALETENTMLALAIVEVYELILGGM